MPQPASSRRSPTAEELDRAQHRAADRASAASRARSPPARWPTAPRCPCSRTSASPEGAAEAVALGAEGVGLFRTEFLFLELDRGADGRAAARVVHAAARRRSPARRSSCACSTRAPTSRSRSSTTRTRRTRRSGLRGIRALRASEDILREQLTALAEADAADRGRRPVGHGADGGDRRGDRVLRRRSRATTASRPPESWSRCRRRRCWPTASSSTRTSPRSARTT